MPPELGYPENDFNKSGPKPTTFSVLLKPIDAAVAFMKYVRFHEYLISNRANEHWILC